MSQQERIEEQIRGILATETQAVPLSHKLFSPEGLFSKLAGTEDERRRVAQTPLFKQAQQRLTELQRTEMGAFSRPEQPHQPVLPS